MRRRQIGLRARNKLAQLSPNSRGILANVARLPGSSNFSSILLPSSLSLFSLFSFFLSLSLSLPLLPLFSSFVAPLNEHVDALRTNALSKRTGGPKRSLEKSRERLVESDSNRVRTAAQPWKRFRYTFVHARRFVLLGGEKEFRENTREIVYLTILARASCRLIFLLNVSVTFAFF